MTDEDWQCTWEKVTRTSGGPAVIADCSERALSDTYPPRCWNHEGLA